MFIAGTAIVISVLKNYMKKNLIIAAAALASVAAYFILRKVFSKEEEAQTPARSHHLTDVFSKAKEFATHN